MNSKSQIKTLLNERERYTKQRSNCVKFVKSWIVQCNNCLKLYGMVFILFVRTWKLDFRFGKKRSQSTRWIELLQDIFDHIEELQRIWYGFSLNN